MSGSMELSEYLLEKTRVGVVPGIAFGAEDLEEGSIGLEGRSVWSGLFNEMQAEVQGRCGGGAWELGYVWVESYA